MRFSRVLPLVLHNPRTLTKGLPRVRSVSPLRSHGSIIANPDGHHSRSPSSTIGASRVVQASRCKLRGQEAQRSNHRPCWCCATERRSKRRDSENAESCRSVPAMHVHRQGPTFCCRRCCEPMVKRSRILPFSAGRRQKQRCSRQREATNRYSGQARRWYQLRGQCNH